ncbi:T9SS type A sorting domain-containing protein [Flavobacterium sp. SUN052]|uniref:Ig-like domain-containing protein n=1 Tax=Flavobacterium sp. SUN052 TaxID=3002441 RepID=UPI00237D934D|nr:T9SS type A sorting domain-containing protein [Flavobacterium sp. SUN052]MEC4004735.1 T9SS type A sorting domain-containing protein [Flavobacterium sp. SUN052]
MKTTKNYIVVFLIILLSHLSSFAQYNGGTSSGSFSEELSTTSCGIPAHFNAYFGGNNDGATVDEFSNTACGIPPSFFAYLGGDNDGATVDELSATACGIPPSFFAYMGGDNDGATTDETIIGTCPFPPSFYAYFGGDNDGAVVDATPQICPTAPPVASFTASAIEICVGQSVTFTDTSTNIPSAWTWTFTGGTPNSSTVQNPVITYNTAGSYAVTLVAANYNGTGTVTLNSYINVYANPSVTSTTPASRCDAGTVTLQATTNVGTLNWYANSTGGTAIATGTSFTTPSIAATTMYYVESINGVCTSTRVPVIATVNTTPTITSTTPASRCDAGSVTLNATASAGNTIWYANPTGGTPLATTNNFTTPSIGTTTTYYVEATTGSCTSPRTAVIATINTTPIITSTTPASRCDSGTIALSATANSGTINWFANASGGTSLATGTSFTTPSISVSTTYYVETSNGTCTSVRTAVTATVNVTPIITSTTPSSRCDAGTVTLSATANAGTISWYANATGGTALATGSSFTTPSISVTTTYYVESVNGGCTSPRTAVIATVNTSPTITSTTPDTICSGDTFTISATASAGTLAWYNVPTGGTIQGTGSTFSLTGLASTVTFYVQATNGSCQSARIPVIVTVNQTPSNTSAVSASRCGPGSVTLTATYSNGTINWYDAPTAGTLVFTGSNFVTPNLSSTTTYYVEGANGTCISSVRTAVTATINAVPTVTSTTPASRCGTGSVVLNASSSVGSLVWYNVATGGTALATGTSFTTPSITSTTTYYVEATNGICTSTRTAVTATIDDLQTITGTTPNSRCDAGTLTLSATATGGTLNWYATATGGTSIATGSNFTTPSISTTTTYYVEVSNGTCTSSRVAVTASIQYVSAPTGNSNQTFCSGETVGLLVTTGTNIVWYDAASGGIIIPNNTLLVSGTTYFASQNNGTCESPTRLAVTTTLGGCLGNESFVFNEIKMYPNPVTDILNISNTEVMSKVEVIDMLGRTLSSKTINDLETKIEMSNLPTGTYLIQVTIDNVIKTFKVIKK